VKIFRENIEKLSPYVPGEQPQDGDFIKLNTNENPYPPSPKALEAMKAALTERLRLYPDPALLNARRAAAQRFAVKPENVIIGNGSDELLTLIVRACVNPGEAVAFPWPTYSLYETLADIQGARALKFDFPPDYSLPEGLAAARARVFFICNPNSPTGTVVAPEEVRRFAQRADGLVVVDEAYADFSETDCMSLAGRLENVIVLRTLSKSASLCGIRCGIGVANERIIETLFKVKDSYNVNAVTLAGAAAALADWEWSRANAEKVKATRERLSERLRAMGFSVLPSGANFIWAEPKRVEAGTIFEKLKERRIYVRYFSTPELCKGLRITVGTDREVDALLEALREIIGEA